MAARYCTDSFVLQLASGASILIHAGSLRDSLHASVVANPNAFSVSPPVAGQGRISGKLAQYLAVYPAGPEL
jgi:hypothetical protein